MLKIESPLLNSANGQHTFTPELHQILGKYCIDIDRLRVQIAMLSDTIKTALDGTVKTVTNVRTIADALNQSRVVFLEACSVRWISLFKHTPRSL